MLGRDIARIESTCAVWFKHDMLPGNLLDDLTRFPQRTAESSVVGIREFRIIFRESFAPIGGIGKRVILFRV